MIMAIGIDTVENYRFATWHTKSYTSLRRIFSEQEIEYCLQHLPSSAERFAVRFATKEAFTKALSLATNSHGTSLLIVCKAVSVEKKTNGIPYLKIQWNLLPNMYTANESMQWHLSLTHSKQASTALIVAEKIEF
jgi:holo-[acyl-carrier protein] synthase